MIIFIQSITDRLITGRARAESDDGTVGDMFFEIEPGQSCNGVTFEDFKAHGLGAFELPQIDSDSGTSTAECPPEC